MKRVIVTAAAMILAAWGMTAVAAELKSGLQPGDAPPAFNVQDVTGPAKGTSLCYRCRYGARPTVSIFTRNIDDNVISLIKQIDKQVAKNDKQQMRAFVVLLTDDPDAAESKLQDLAKKNDIQNVPLTIFDGQVGPPDYKIAENADVTVLMWNKSKVAVNHAFEKGKLNKQAVETVAKDTGKILN